jgi:hypothetical protein
VKLVWLVSLATLSERFPLVWKECCWTLEPTLVDSRLVLLADLKLFRTLCRLSIWPIGF